MWKGEEGGITPCVLLGAKCCTDSLSRVLPPVGHPPRVEQECCKGVVIDVSVFCEKTHFYQRGEGAMEKFRKDEGFICEKQRPLPDKQLQQHAWLLFKYSENSRLARGIAIISGLITLIFIFISCLETLSEFWDDGAHELTGGTLGPSSGLLATDLFANSSSLAASKMLFVTGPFRVETLCLIWFSFESLVHLFACPSKATFSKTIMNIIDIVAIILYFITLGTALAKRQGSGQQAVSPAILKVVWLVRVFKLLRRSKELQILGRTLKASAVGRCYARMTCRLMASDTCRWSRDAYIEHITMHRQYQEV